MNKIYSPEKIKERENRLINEIGFKAEVLMERAALALSDCVKEKLKSKSDRVLIVAGCGNNGGDGIALARILIGSGIKTSLYVLESPHKSELFSYEYKLLQSIASYTDNTLVFPPLIKNEYAVVVDCMFGTGLNRDLSEEYISIINQINFLDAYVISADVPSGIDSSTGKLRGGAVKADLTVTFAGYKTGLFLKVAPDYTGIIKCVDIGINMECEEPDAFAISEADFENNPLYVKNTAHKGTYGKTFVIAGSKDIYGAAFLCAKASFYSGAGLVKIVTHENNRYSLEHDIPEAMFDFYDDEPDIDNLIKDISSFDTIVCGPGLGTGNAAKSIVNAIADKGIFEDKIYVFDADAINVLAADAILFAKLSNMCREKGAHIVFTPHGGELKRLSDSLGAENADFTHNFYQNYGMVLVEKSAKTHVFGKNVYVNFSGNEGMATAGSGDVLAGILGGLCYRTNKNTDVDFAKSVAFSVFLHGYAGNLAKDCKGAVAMTATDILENIPNAWERLINEK